MSATFNKNKKVMTNKQVIRNIIVLFKSIESGETNIINDNDSVGILNDIIAMSECEYCDELQNNFWFNIVPLKSRVILTSKLINPISLLSFFVVRKSKLSIHRLKNGHFNADEWNRIKRTLEIMVDLDFSVYDLRYNDQIKVELDNDTTFYHISF